MIQKNCLNSLKFSSRDSIGLLAKDDKAYAKIFQELEANLHATQLYEDLMGSYNKIVLPVRNASDVLLIKFGASLIRIIDIVKRKLFIIRIIDIVKRKLLIIGIIHIVKRKLLIIRIIDIIFKKF